MENPRAEPDNFVIRFANVNGSGSASSNALIARCIFRMGHTIGAKNMFPSNIQGFPTWYEIRVSSQGYTARRGGVDLMVAMNGQTILKDAEDLEKGGVLIYDSTRPIAERLRRQDVLWLDLPLTELARRHFPDSRQRTLLQNMICTGVLCRLLRLDETLLRELISGQYRSKSALLPVNIKAFELGCRYAAEHFKCLPFYVTSSGSGERLGEDAPLLMNGNTAMALGALFAGATVCGWYPITPSTSLIDAFSDFCQRYRTDHDSGEKKYAIIQAEDEIAAIGMVLGASWMGARAFTATSGPGISLMCEFLGYGYYAEIPAVIFNIQRCGPSTGMPTRNQQADLLICAYASHGDSKHIMIFPAGPDECFEFARKAFDWAERYQTPVFVMSDLDAGMNDAISPPLKAASFAPDRGKVLGMQELEQLQGPFLRYADPDGDGIPYRTLPGVHQKGSYFTRGSGHDRAGRYTEDGALYQENMRRIAAKFKTAARELPEPLFPLSHESASSVIISYGSGSEAVKEAIDLLKADGIYLNHMRIRAFPFSARVRDFCLTQDRCLVLDLNRDGQMACLLRNEFPELAPLLIPLCLWDGLPVQAEQLVRDIRTLMPGAL
ncbi:MAG: 2-oxoacid:acceptor oxidoreductase subunit alpha [Deltaproteobacteria bacterium]|nr:2-oxoacid:acceptor oxidoreductase subunit alpha [Deltaproteobacteria bacterium]